MPLALLAGPYVVVGPSATNRVQDFAYTGGGVAVGYTQVSGQPTQAQMYTLSGGALSATPLQTSGVSGVSATASLGMAVDPLTGTMYGVAPVASGEPVYNVIEWTPSGDARTVGAMNYTGSASGGVWFASGGYVPGGPIELTPNYGLVGEAPQGLPFASPLSTAGSVYDSAFHGGGWTAVGIEALDWTLYNATSVVWQGSPSSGFTATALPCTGSKCGYGAVGQTGSLVGGYAYQSVGGTSMPFAVYSDLSGALGMLTLLDSTGNAVPGFLKAVVETTAGGMFGGYRNEVYTIEAGGGTTAYVYPAGAFICLPGEGCDTADNVWARLNPGVSLPTSITAIDKFVIDPTDSSHMMWIMNKGTMMAESNNPYTLLGYDSGVPEPATWALGGMGLAGFALWRGRRAVQRNSR